MAVFPAHAKKLVKEPSAPVIMNTYDNRYKHTPKMPKNTLPLGFTVYW